MPRRQSRAFYKAGEAVLAYGLTMTRFYEEMHKANDRFIPAPFS